MKSITSLFLGLFVSSAALASASGPRYAVEDLYEAAKKGKFSEFQSLLVGPALAQLGSAQGMASVKAEGDLHDYDFGMEKELTREDPGPAGYYSVRTYQVEVESDKTDHVIRRPLVECLTREYWHPGSCFRRCDYRGCWQDCQPGYTTLEEDFCRISQW